MPDSTDALLDMMYALTTTYQVRLAPEAVRTCREIFDLTVANFARQSASKSIEAHPWADTQFRDFILGQVRRVAAVAKERANGEAVTSSVLQSAAREVLHRTHQVCRVAAEEGKLRFSVYEMPEQLEGGICDAYLESPSMV